MIIGLYGDSRAGKDTVAGFLVDDFDFEQRNLASPIRQILLDLNPLVRGLNRPNAVSLQYAFEQAAGDWDYIKKNYPESVDLMINLGQAARDHIGENVWLDAVVKDIPKKLVIADVRQPNEYNKIRELDGQIWRVVRPGTERRGMDGLLDHAQFDRHVDNSSTELNLRHQVQAIMQSG